MEPDSLKFDAAILIGRFQPFHNGHAALLAHALDIARRVIVVVGSAYGARSPKNPFSWEERTAMIGATLNESQRLRVSFLPMRDYYDDVRWADRLTGLVRAAGHVKVALVGHLKDASSQYLNRFPDWEFLAEPRRGEVDASAIRDIWFGGEDENATRALLTPLVPPAVMHYLRGWMRLPYFEPLRTEHRALVEYHKHWGRGPFVTVDAVVRASDQVLLVRRGRSPGKGLLALPGGFLDAHERVLQGAIRELREETRFALLDSELEAALSGVAVFDHPERSLRGRTITHAHFFDLRGTRPPEVQGADDAAEACWIPVTELAAREGAFFEDHFNILNHFLGLVP